MSLKHMLNVECLEHIEAPYQISVLESPLSIRIETGRYERLPVSERICFHCKTCVEDELHVLVNCPLYEG